MGIMTTVGISINTISDGVTLAAKFLNKKIENSTAVVNWNEIFSLHKTCMVKQWVNNWSTNCGDKLAEMWEDQKQNRCHISFI